MIDIFFSKVGRMMCGVTGAKKLAPESERLAAVLGAMVLLALMAGVTLLSLARTARIHAVEAVIILLAMSMPWIIFDFFIKPSSQWLSFTDSTE